MTGFVYNLDGGQVRIIAEGEENKLNAFIGAIQIANTLIKVDDVEVEYADVTGDLNDFISLWAAERLMRGWTQPLSISRN
ncbi:MAG: acylphosphatase [Methanosarcinales archaeon]|nr:acylphosphatase [Methanosarcinales archaeon]MCK4810799.1 acylphosphatase [Methanosarcinales archaeon]